MKTLYAILIITLASCATSKDSLTVQPIAKSWPNADLQAYASEAVYGIPRFAGDTEYCPNGMTQRNYTHLLAAIAKHESNFNPSLIYKESFRNGRGEYVISTGLHQVSYESSRGYGFPGITTQDLKDPYLNIAVAAAILKKLVSRDGVLSEYRDGRWRGGSAYWSTLRSTGKLSSVKAYLARFCE